MAWAKALCTGPTSARNNATARREDLQDVCIVFYLDLNEDAAAIEKTHRKKADTDEKEGVQQGSKLLVRHEVLEWHKEQPTEG